MQIGKKSKIKCPECGSHMTVDDGYMECTQNLLQTNYPEIFEEWDKLDSGKLQLMLDNVSYQVYDMYSRWKVVCPETGERTEFCCTYNPNLEFNPMTKNEMILPDPAQTKIAEAILGRKLTHDEYYGLSKVPLLSEKGLKNYRNIAQYVFPRDYIPKYKDMVVKTDFEATPVIFKWKNLKDY
jgi:hypothetical protein